MSDRTADSKLTMALAVMLFLIIGGTIAGMFWSAAQNRDKIIQLQHDCIAAGGIYISEPVMCVIPPDDIAPTPSPSPTRKPTSSPDVTIQP